MREYIYYPGFEVKDELWLKFALLYIEKIYPIIPHSGDTHLTEAYRRLRDETDLIAPHRPTDEDSFRASEIAIRSIEGAFRRRQSYKRFFSGDNYLSQWQNRDNHQYRLFYEKFTRDFEYFCLENELGSRCDEGINISEELAYFYMTHLALEVGKERDLPIITDYEKYDKINNTFIYGYNKQKTNVDSARYIVKMAMPVDIYDITLTDIIKLRNSNGYTELLKSFNIELSNFLTIAGTDTKSYLAFNEYVSAKMGITDLLLQRGWQLVSVLMGTWLVFDNPTVGQYIKETLVAGGSVLTDSIISFRNVKEGTRDKRNASRFLTNLSKVRRG